jgi:hypothetical protein
MRPRRHMRRDQSRNVRHSRHSAARYEMRQTLSVCPVSTFALHLSARKCDVGCRPCRADTIKPAPLGARSCYATPIRSATLTTSTKVLGRELSMPSLAGQMLDALLRERLPAAAPRRCNVKHAPSYIDGMRLVRSLLSMPVACPTHLVSICYMPKCGARWVLDIQQDAAARSPLSRLVASSKLCQDNVVS